MSNMAKKFDSQASPDLKKNNPDMHGNKGSNTDLNNTSWSTNTIIRGSTSHLLSSLNQAATQPTHSTSGSMADLLLAVTTASQLNFK